MYIAKETTFLVMHDQAIPRHYMNPVKSTLLYSFLAIMILLLSCHRPPAEKYGFITQLGVDTISVESVTRQGNTITTDEVDRFPRLRIRHTVINLATDGSIQHLVMDIRTPSEPSNQRDRKVIAYATATSVHISKTDGTGTLKRDFTTGGGTVVAHVPQMYSLYELYFAAALKHAATSTPAAGKPVEMRQFYIDREFDRFPLGRGLVKPIGNGKVEITHDWLSGTGEATMDSAHRMLSYSGARTTYKVRVNRLSLAPDVKSVADRFEDLETKAGIVKQLSVRDTVRAKIGNVLFTVDYSRPLLRGRKLLGDVLPYDRVWRTGANAATQFTTSAPIKLAGMQVPAGTYTLWTIPHKNGADLIVNRQTGQWGTEYNNTRNLGIAKINIQLLSEPVEAFTISITPDNTQHGMLTIEWGSFRWTAPIEEQ